MNLLNWTEGFMNEGALFWIGSDWGGGGGGHVYIVLEPYMGTYTVGVITSS